MIKHYLIILLIIGIAFVFTPNTNAWYGAGYSPGWPNAITGGMGEIVSPYYKAAPSFYQADEPIIINFSIKNPINNPSSITHEVFLKLWKVEKLNPETDLITESQLYLNHNANLDIQSPYKTILLGELGLAPGQNSNLKAEFAITDPGYYQFDITDLDQASSYKPGHIYTAGFLRVKASPLIGDVMGTNDESGSIRISAMSIWVLLLFIAILMLILLFIFRKRRRELSENTL